MPLDNLPQLEAEWAVFLEDRPGRRAQWTQDQRWRHDNPGELAKLLAYRAGGARPELVTEPGRRMLRHLDAWHKAKADPPSPPPPPPPSGTVDVYRLTLRPDADGNTSRWRTFVQPGTDWYAPQDNNQAQAPAIRFGPGQRYETDPCCVLWSIRHMSGRGFGRGLDLHCPLYEASDPHWPYANLNGQSTDIAPIAVDYYQGIREWDGTEGLMLTTQCYEDGPSGPAHTVLLSPAEMQARLGGWIDLALRIKFGRFDEPRGLGRIEAFVDGALVADIHVNTHWKFMEHVLAWMGGYWAGGGAYTLDGDTVCEMTPYLAGRSFAEASASVPTEAGPGWNLQGSINKTGTRPRSDIKLPSI